MTDLKAIIADDEAQLLMHLKKRLQDVWPELMICGEAKNGIEAWEMIRILNPDFAFLDIKMPGMTGLEVAGKVLGSCRVVFVTAYDQYAIDAFDNEAVDYLLKPVTTERLGRTIERLKKRTNSGQADHERFMRAIETVMERNRHGQAKEYLRWIKVLKNDSIRLIPVDDIYYFQATDKYTSVVTAEGEALIKKPIKELEDELDPENFWRIHRGTIVNVDSIEKVSTSITGRMIVKMRQSEELLTVSRSYSHLFKQM